MTIPSELEEKLEEFISGQPAPPSLAAVVQVALRRLLEPTPDEGPSPINTVLAQRSAIVEAARRHGVNDIRLFGSVARGEAGVASDVDFLVEVDEGTTLFDLAHLRLQLEELLDLPVDVVTTGGLEGDARTEVLAEAIRL